MKRFSGTPILTQTAGSLFFTGLFSFLIGLMLFGAVYPTSQDLLGTLPLTFAASWILLVPSTLLMLSITKRLFPGRVGILMMSEVFVAIFSATLLLPEEVMSMAQWFGGGLIILACLCEVFVSTQET
jgi:drug/metabolite transporter (DMT)-like permease